VIVAVVCHLLGGTEALGQVEPRRAKTLPAAMAPVIDGVLDDACWTGDPTLAGFSVYTKADVLHPDQTRGWVCYDDNHLYIALDCAVGEMDKFRERMAGIEGTLLENYGKGGVMEIFFDLNHDRETFQQYLLHAKGTTYLTLFAGDELKILNDDYIERGIAITEGGYVMELAFPLAMLHLRPDTAKVWGFNAGRVHDILESGSATDDDHLSAWNPVLGKGFPEPAFFGDLEIDADFSRYYWDVRFAPDPQPGDREIRLRLRNDTGKAFAGAMELAIVRSKGDVSRYTEEVKVDAAGTAVVSFPHAVGGGDVEARYELALRDADGDFVFLGGTQKKDLTPGDPWPAPEPTEAERRAGYIVYRRPYTSPVLYRSVPKRKEVAADLSAFGCRDEYVPLTFSLYPLEYVTDLSVTAGDLIGPGGAVIPAAAVDIRWVTHQFVWKDSRSFKAQENLLRHFDRLNLTTGRSRRFWLTAKIASGQKPGKYTGTITVSSNRGETRLPLNLTVLPFRLASVEDMGYFMYANGSLTKNPEHVRKVARDMREHGMTTATVYYFNEIGHRTEDLRLVVDEPVGYSEETGYVVNPQARGGLSYAGVIDILVEAGFARETPLIEMYSAGMEWGYKVELVAELDRIFKERHWPEVIYYLHDEFDLNEERTRRARQRFAALRKAGLGHLRYTTAITAQEKMRERTDALAPLYDVWILGTPSADLLVKGHAMGKTLWSYGWNYSHNYTTADLRHYFGRYLWKTGLKGASLWCYNNGKFQDRFNRTYTSRDAAFTPEQYLLFSYVWYENDEIIPTARWEAIREGVDDYRYLRTLKQSATAAAVADDGELREAGMAGLQLLAEIRDTVPLVDTCARVADEDKPSLAGMDTERRRVAEAILAILKANGTIGGEWNLKD